MEQTLKIIWDNPAIWFWGLALVALIYVLIKHVIPRMWHKPKNELDWLMLIFFILVILGIIRMFID